MWDEGMGSIDQRQIVGNRSIHVRNLRNMRSMVDCAQPECMDFMDGREDRKKMLWEKGRRRTGGGER